MESDGKAIYANVGKVAGGIAFAVTFVGVWIAAVESVGWVIGIALGWIAAGLAAGLAWLIGRYLWFPILIVAVIFFASRIK